MVKNKLRKRFLQNGFHHDVIYACKINQSPLNSIIRAEMKFTERKENMFTVLGAALAVAGKIIIAIVESKK